MCVCVCDNTNGRLTYVALDRGYILRALIFNRRLMHPPVCTYSPAQNLKMFHNISALFYICIISIEISSPLTWVASFYYQSVCDSITFIIMHQHPIFYLCFGRGTMPLMLLIQQHRPLPWVLFLLRDKKQKQKYGQELARKCSYVPLQTNV